MKQLTILSFAILFSGTSFCQTPQTGPSTETTISVKETPIMYHRARIYYDGPKGILLLAKTLKKLLKEKKKEKIQIDINDKNKNSIFDRMLNIR